MRFLLRGFCFLSVEVSLSLSLAYHSAKEFLGFRGLFYLNDVPYAVEFIARRVASLLVVHPVVKWFSFVCPLFASVITGDDFEVACLFCISSRCQRWPCLNASVVTNTLS